MVIVGEGPERLRLAQLFKLHGCDENVILVGPKDDRELPSFYAAADICIMPMAYQVPELVMLEAMACGKPVIFTSRGFCELEGDFVHERNIIMAKDEQDIADRSVQMLMDSRKRQAIGAAGRATVVSKYSWPMIASKTLKVYESVL
jgi:glycosyltransferase involved in cell wall biosynthesis